MAQGGRALAWLDLDNRPEVMTLSGIEWKEVPGGKFKYGHKDEEDNKPRTLTLPTFYISRFPITQAQFQSFLDDPAGADDPRWFEGLTNDEDDRRIEEPWFKFANHPRDNISWIQAMAFCRWWSWRLGTTYDLDKVAQWAVRLPTEFEWERAARGKNGLVYPYGNDYAPEKGNTDDTGIGQTSAVGIFPNGASPDGVEEMSGNVLEWCLSHYDNPALNPSDEDLRTGDVRRVLRGGSWFGSHLGARAVYRFNFHPAYRNLDSGFRLVVLHPPSS
ncbi:MAG TPA: SUMF1/EgtB/PvdO family nonheme iron enzyme [Blastocatellia bacterium]|nr:SUMF1/EgtB/PvdO family nonheme iron enzyme [Blastocatellia bacterium]HMV84691.1 SUMF1/EgtB/PvdO family nonheme iron enzyme [Blastocatellia bacterium]HMX25386.1 SUMF1/EgtB/PvdO family nonheme iron enzyme [Blastocatellia bacterium]HMY73842.1 SUMF1/EgtB/PvdO family nonheme iron enzyme [Blastocatellia bacterium]HMZ21359.1 SUMF1/EgtB/PvdO family nonheme iron enzyme [Blastocatellia bacterium]